MKFILIFYPFKNAQRLCVVQSLWAFYIGILAKTPNPFPSGKGCIAGAAAPSPCRGLRPCDPVF